MNITQFHFLLANNFIIYLLLFISLSGVTFFFCYKLKVAITEPLAPAMLSIVFAMSMIVFLFMTDNVSVIDFFIIMLCYGSLFLGMTIFPVYDRSMFKPPKYNTYKSLYFMQFASIVVYVSSVLITFTVAGIPLFMESRLATFSSGGGFGVISRVIEASAYLFVLTSCWLFSISKYKKLQVIFLIMYIILSTMMGGKSGFLLIIFCFYLVNCFVNKPHTFPLKYFLLIMAFLLAYYVTAHSVDLFTSALFLLQRLIKFGDVYFLILPDEGYKNLTLSMTGVEALFSDLLGLTRLYSWREFGESLGYQAYNLVNPSNTVLTGPNIRFDIFALIYFGYFSPIFSLILGIIISFIRGPLLRHINYQNTFVKAIYGFLSIQIVVLISDPILGMTRLNNIVCLLLLLIFPILFYNIARVKNKRC